MASDDPILGNDEQLAIQNEESISMDLFVSSIIQCSIFGQRLSDRYELYINDELIDSTEIDDNGVISFPYVNTDMLSPNQEMTIYVKGVRDNDDDIMSDSVDVFVNMPSLAGSVYYSYYLLKSIIEGYGVVIGSDYDDGLMGLINFLKEYY